MEQRHHVGQQDTELARTGLLLCERTQVSELFYVCLRCLLRMSVSNLCPVRGRVLDCTHGPAHPVDGFRPQKRIRISFPNEKKLR